MWSKLRMRSEKNVKVGEKQLGQLNFLRPFGVAEFISGDKFTTKSRINALTAHAQASSQSR